MADRPTDAGDPVFLPDPLPQCLPPAEESGPTSPKSYFNPRQWDAEAANPPVRDEGDPVALGLGKQEGRGRAVLFLGDCHMADGTAAGDDFLSSHLAPVGPGVYYNTGTWISTLVAPGGEEKQVEAFPFLLVYLGKNGSRVEEYYIACDAAPERPAYARLQTPESVNEFRKEFGYKELPR
jgi:hypothetical protein